MAAEPADRLERSEPGRHILWGERPPEIGAKREDHVDSTRRNARSSEAPEDRSSLIQVDVRAQVPLHERVRTGALREYPELGHRDGAADTLDEFPRHLAADPR